MSQRMIGNPIETANQTVNVSPKRIGIVVPIEWEVDWTIERMTGKVWVSTNGTGTGRASRCSNDFARKSGIAKGWGFASRVGNVNLN